MPEPHVHVRSEDVNEPEPHAHVRSEDVDVPEAHVHVRLEDVDVPKAHVHMRLEDVDMMVPSRGRARSACAHAIGRRGRVGEVTST